MYNFDLVCPKCMRQGHYSEEHKTDSTLICEKCGAKADILSWSITANRILRDQLSVTKAELKKRAHAHRSSEALPGDARRLAKEVSQKLKLIREGKGPRDVVRHCGELRWIERGEWDTKGDSVPQKGHNVSFRRGEKRGRVLRCFGYGRDE